MTKVPLAESRSLLVVMESTVGHQEKGQEEEVEKQGEVEGEGEKLKGDATWMECGWSGKR